MTDAFHDYKRSMAQSGSVNQCHFVGSTIGTSHLRTWVKEGDSPPRYPYLILITTSNTGLIYGSNIAPESPSAVQGAQVLFNTTFST